MIFFSHLGIGNTLAAPFRKGLPQRWILLGTVLPDLMDKPLYYGLSWWTGKHGTELGLISGTRTFGHTGLFLMILGGMALSRKSRILAATTIGVATHLVLDGVTDYYWMVTVHMDRFSALFWPFLTLKFPVLPFHTIREHMQNWKNPFFIGSEVVGALLLAWQVWKHRNKSEIVNYFKRRRLNSRLKKSRRSG